MGLWGLGKEKHKSHTVPSCGVPDIISITKSLSAQDVIKNVTSESSVVPAPAELVTMPNLSFLFFSFSSSSVYTERE